MTLALLFPCDPEPAFPVESGGRVSLIVARRAYVSENVRHIEPWQISLIESYDLQYHFTPIRPA